MTTIRPAGRIPGELLRSAEILAHRDELLNLLPKQCTFVEVGIGLGLFSEKVIRVCLPRHFVAIDIFQSHLMKDIHGVPSEQFFGGKTHVEFYRDKIAGIIPKDKSTVLVGDSAEMLMSFPDGYFDVIYVDADHRYNAVVKDIAAAKNKVAVGGFLIMNDYILYDHVAKMEYGVIQATNEFMIAEKWRMKYFILNESMFCDVVLQK